MGRSSWSATSFDIGAHNRPDERRTVHAIHSGVASCADKMMSPSFSRSSLSATMTGRPCLMASRASSMVEMPAVRSVLMRFLIGCRNVKSGLVALKGEHALNMAGDDVGLDVHAIADLEFAERGCLERLGNERHLEPLSLV